MTTLTQIPYDNTYVEEYSKKHKEPAWMTELRLEGLDHANALELPKPDKSKITHWNFTSFKHAVEADVIDNLTEVPAALKDFIDTENLPENIVILRNQQVAYSTLNEELANKGVIFTDIFTALQEHGDLVKQYYMTEGLQVNDHKLAGLHAALMNGGVFVYIPEGVEIETPLQTIFWQENEEAALFNHVLVVAEKNSKVTYVENYLSSNENTAAVANIVAEVYAKDYAEVSFGAVDHFEAGMTTFIHRRGIASADATIDWALGQMNEGNTVSENVTDLVGDRSATNAMTVTVGRSKQIQNFTARTVHHGKDTDGQILQRGVLNGKTTAIFNAIGKIEHLATRSNAEQESRLLMLSPDARGDANPILLIDEDDVTAGHAASVGRVDEMQLYYLQSRGISKAEAERLIIHGFLAPVVGKLPVEKVKQQLSQLIEGKIN